MALAAPGFVPEDCQITVVQLRVNYPYYWIVVIEGRCIVIEGTVIHERGGGDLEGVNPCYLGCGSPFGNFEW